MGWETRKGSKRKFYYRKVRVGGRVRSVYCGAGEAGERAAREDAERRDEPPTRSQPPTPITRAEIVGHAELNGDRSDFLARWCRESAQGSLTRGAIWSALSKAGIKDEEVTARGLDIGPASIAGMLAARARRPARAGDSPLSPRRRSGW
jgi:hypothetical protein